MSFQASHWTLHEVQDLKPQERLLLLVLAEHADMIVTACGRRRVALPTRWEYRCRRYVVT